MSAEAVTVTEVRVLEGPNLYFAPPRGQGQPRGAPATSPPTRGRLRELEAPPRACAVCGPAPPTPTQRQRFVMRLESPRRAAGRPRLGHHPARRTHPHRRHPRPGRGRLPVALAGPRRRPRGVAGHGPPGPLVDGTQAEGRGRHPGRRRAGVGGRAGRAARVLPTPRIPVASVTGTNGKTTTTRLLGPHRDDRRPSSPRGSSTDGVLAQGELLRRATTPDRPVPGPSWTAPGGAAGHPGDGPRGACCSRAWGSRANDVSVVTNVSVGTTSAAGDRHRGPAGRGQGDRHPGHQAGPGWVVLNGDDPRVWAMRSGARGRPWAFSLRPGLTRAARVAQRRRPRRDRAGR